MSELAHAGDAQLRAGHPDPEAFVERAFHFHAGSLHRLQLSARPDQLVALAVVGAEPVEAALETDVLHRPGHLHRSVSRARSPRPTIQTKIALASSHTGVSSDGIQGSETVFQAAACSSITAQPNASPATAAPKRLCSGR